MKIYVAGHSQSECRTVAEMLMRNGHTVTSTWLSEDFARTGSYTDAEKSAIALKDAYEVSESDAMVFLSSPIRVPGGKFVEAGIAIGRGKPVYLIGVRENMLMWHYLVCQVATADDLCKKLSDEIQWGAK